MKKQIKITIVDDKIKCESVGLNRFEMIGVLSYYIDLLKNEQLKEQKSTQKP